MLCDPCDKVPEDEMDMAEISDAWYARERELIDRAEAQQAPDWYKVAAQTCLPSLAFTAITEPVR